MAIEVVDGTLEPAQPRSIKRGYGRFDGLRIRTADGQVRDFPKVATGEPVTAEAIRGGEGRFYFTTADGPLGLFGVRRPDGSSYYAHFSNVETLILIVGLLGSLGTTARFGFGVDFPLLAAVLGPLLLLGWIYLDGKRRKAKRAFDAENA